MEDKKLETAKYDSRGRCVRHPNTPLRGMNVDQGDGGGMASKLERMAGPPKIGRGGGAGGGYGSGLSPSQDLDGHRHICLSSSQQQGTTVYRRGTLLRSCFVDVMEDNKLETAEYDSRG